MTTQRRQRFIHAQVAWMLTVVVVLAAIGSLSLELFFFLSLVGFFLVVELTSPVAVTPPWRRRIRWIIAAGFLVFAYLVARRLFEILSGVI